MSTFINLEILHTLPYANANRDDSGLPKMAVIGGTTRGRLSSQSLKRAARFYGADRSNGFGDDGSAYNTYFRTKLVHNLITTELQSRGVEDESIFARVDEFFDSKSVLGKISKGKGKDTSLRQDVLTLVTAEEVVKLADYVLSDEWDSKNAIPEVTKILNESGKRDIALWGRFFASGVGGTMDGSAQVAHAFTTHSAAVQSDFFVGLDDASSLYSDHAGAGHPDTAYYMSGTFYKYANINVEETLLNLVNGQITTTGVTVPEEIDIAEVTEQFNLIVKEFVKSLALSVPQGKIRSSAHNTLPSLVRMAVLDGRAVSGATAFEYPVTSEGEGVIANSINALASYHARAGAIFEDTPRYAGYVTTESAVDGKLEALGSNEAGLSALIDQVIEAYAPIVNDYLESLYLVSIVDNN